MPSARTFAPLPCVACIVVSRIIRSERLPCYLPRARSSRNSAALLLLRRWGAVATLFFWPSFIHVCCAVAAMNAVCDLCGYRHGVASRCPVYSRNAYAWVDAVDASAWTAPVPVHELTAFDVVCPHCRARSWREEHMDCCGGGRLQLQCEEEIPHELSEAILSSHVRQHIRR